jgi:hypothetical protein
LAILFADFAIMFADSRPESTFWIFGKPIYNDKVLVWFDLTTLNI